MLRLLSYRALDSVVVIAALSFLTYALIGLMPGDPADLLIAADPDISATEAAALRARYGLDRPLLERYGDWALAALRGDFGFSRQFGQPALGIIGERIVNSLYLLTPAFLLSIAIALPLGVMAARFKGRVADDGISLFCFAGISVPPFWLALMLILTFAVIWPLLPAGGMERLDRGAEESAILDRLTHLILPTLCLTLLNLGHYIRFMRSAMIEALREDHIRTARAKGNSQGRLLWRHAAPNALLPVVTIIALNFGALFSGALITETMFSYPGLGQAIYEGILANDFNLALIGLLFAAIMVIAGNLIADLLYAAIDPRVSFEAAAT